VRLQDLSADPMGEVERIYRELGLPFTDAFRANLGRLLASAPAHVASAKPRLTEAQKRRATPRLAPLAAAFEHGRPAIRAVAPPSAGATRLPRRRVAATAALLASGLCLAGWVGVAITTGDAQNWFVWPTGLALGYATLAVTRSGSTTMGWWAAILTGATFVAASLVNTWSFRFGGSVGVPFLDLVVAAFQDRRTAITLFWLAMGLISAYRVGSGTRP